VEKIQIKEEVRSKSKMDLEPSSPKNESETTKKKKKKKVVKPPQINGPVLEQHP
jgi:hypothetical protein